MSTPLMIADRLTAQQLSGPVCHSPEQVVQRLLAVQAQDQRGARLSIRARSVGLSATDLDDALTQRRTLLVSWLNRGTLHLVRTEDYWWLHPLTTPQLATANRRRLAQEGVSDRQAARGVELIVEHTSNMGPRTRAELRTALDRAGVPTAGQAIVHLLLAATLGGHIVRGPIRDGEHCFVATTDWLGMPPEPLDRPVALAKLALRYLAGHGPAHAQDLAKWAGLTLADARTGLAASSDALVERRDGLLDLADRPAPAALPGPRLLGPFDPLLHGWSSREFVLGPHAGIVTTNGIFRPFVLVSGRAVGTWTLPDGRVRIRPLERISRADRTALSEDSADVLRYLGLVEREPLFDTT